MQSGQFLSLISTCLPGLRGPRSSGGHHTHSPDWPGLGASAPHLVRVRAIPVRHDFRLPVTHYVHLRREQGSGSPPAPPQVAPHPREADTANVCCPAPASAQCALGRSPGSLTLKWSRSSAVTAYGAPITTSDTYCRGRGRGGLAGTPLGWPVGTQELREAAWWGQLSRAPEGPPAHPAQPCLPGRPVHSGSAHAGS